MELYVESGAGKPNNGDMNELTFGFILTCI